MACWCGGSLGFLPFPDFVFWGDFLHAFVYTILSCSLLHRVWSVETGFGNSLDLCILLAFWPGDDSGSHFGRNPSLLLLLGCHFNFDCTVLHDIVALSYLSCGALLAL